MTHIVTVPMVQNGKSDGPIAETNHGLFNPMKGDPGDSPEAGQGVYRNLTCDFGQWDAAATAIVLGYLASIWSKVQHPGYPTHVDIPVTDTSGEHFYDLAEHREKYPNFQVSRVTFLIKSYPAGADLVFGEDPLVKAGVCSWLVSNEANFDKDWLPVEPVKVDKSFQVSFAAGGTLSGAATTPNPRTRSFSTGVGLGVNEQNYFYELPVESEAAVTVSGAVTVSNKARQPRKRPLLVASIENSKRDLFPLQWINHLRSTFVPPTPNVNGIWWKLNEGVIADVQIYGTTRDPDVEVTLSAGA